MIVLVVIGFFLYGLFWMKKVDRFIGHVGFTDAPSALEVKDTLVFADLGQMEETQAALQTSPRAFEYISEPALPEQAAYETALALSHNDLDNILLCAQAKKRYPAYTIAVCNNKRYLSVFQDYHIDSVAFSIGEACAMLGRCTPSW